MLLWDLDPQGAATFYVRVKPSVKGGAERLVSDAGSLEAHIRATDDPAVHIVPADFSLRHLDLELDDTKHPTRRLAELLAPIADRYDVALLDCAPGSPSPARACSTPPTRSRWSWGAPTTTPGETRGVGRLSAVRRTLNEDETTWSVRPTTRRFCHGDGETRVQSAVAPANGRVNWGSAHRRW